MTLRVRPYGVSAYLVEFDVPAEHRRAIRDWICREVHTDGVVDVVPAARTVLVRYEGEGAARAAKLVLTALREREALGDIGDLPGSDAVSDVMPELVVPVHYDGEDLAVVAAHLGIRVDDVIKRHQAVQWVVEFTGFTAGFGYLSQVGDPVDLTVPRRATPRTRIPAGAVALADAFGGVYPKASPGGWQLIGTTDLVMFEQHREPPALFVPGQRVRFVDVGDTRAAAGETIVRDAEHAGQDGGWAERGDSAGKGAELRRGGDCVEPALVVEEVGAQALIEDAGRLRQMSVGLATSGAADRRAFRLANRVVGNVEGAAGIEVLFGGLTVRAERAVVVAVSGAPAPLVVQRGRVVRAMEMDTPVLLEQGDVLRLGAPLIGLRSYLAVAGGIAAEAVGGSVSSDPTADIGPAPLVPGVRLGTGLSWSGVAALTELRAAPAGLPTGPLILSAMWGPRADWITEDARQAFAASTYRVGAQSDRVGVRFEGPELARARQEELPSEPLVRGAVQVPADGQPLMFLADHPTTGGYPVIAVIDEDATDLLAQARPGQEVRFAVRGATDGAVEGVDERTD